MTSETNRAERRDTVLVRIGLLVWICAGATLLAGAALSGFARHAPGENTTRNASVRPASARLVVPAERRYTSEYTLRSGDELLLVLVGAGFCGAHRKPGFPQAVENAKLQLQRQARSRGWQFRALGVSLDWKPKEALAFLEAFGEFDEISVGSNWVNESALRYVWRDLPGDPVVPQLVVLKRRVDAGERTLRVTNEQVLHRISGSDDILAWVRSGGRI